MTQPAIHYFSTNYESEDPPQSVIVYICPTPGCGNYYAARDFRPDRTPDIDVPQIKRGPHNEHLPSFARTECPDCRNRGQRVVRVPYIVSQVIDLRKVIPLPAHPHRPLKRSQIAS